MKRLRTEIRIAASPERVWDVLMDFERYPDWNPFVRSIEGSPRPGERIRVRLEPPGMKGMTLRPRVVAVERPRLFRWQGHLFVPGLFDGEHSFEIGAPDGDEDGGVRFVQSERFGGVLVPLLRRLIDENTRRGFDAMNEALKRRAEAA